MIYLLIFLGSISQRSDATQSHAVGCLTFEEAVLAVHHVYSFLLQAGGAVDLAVVLVESAVGAAHGHKRGVAFLLAHTLGSTRRQRQHTLASPAAELPPAGSLIGFKGHWKTESHVCVY